MLVGGRRLAGDWRFRPIPWQRIEVRRTASVCLGALILLACRGSASAESVQPASTEPADLPSVTDDAPGAVGPAPSDEVPPSPAAPPSDEPPAPTIDRSKLLEAPSRYEHVTLRAGLPVGQRYENLIYEGNNKVFRGKLGEDGLYRSGDDTAEDWRRWTAGVGGMVVLRDSLFSQQDHPYLQAPRALMMPPSWVSVAVAETMAGRALRAPLLAPIEDDAAWAGPETSAAMFGSFPVSDRLFEEARVPLASSTDPAQAQRTTNARASIGMLGQAAGAMVAAAATGPDLVAATGAAWIAASDRNYFGTEQRARAIIPIFVEHPNEHESRDEGKGMGVWGMDIPAEAIAIARRAVYARRLEDGALAVERYDLREQAEWDRARGLLEDLVPRGSSGHTLWLWVNGGSDGHGHGNSALPYIEAFRNSLEDADIEMSRVRLLSKPSPRPRGPTAKADFEAAVERARALGVPASIQLNTRSAKKLLP